jgi:hypothetical protein
VDVQTSLLSRLALGAPAKGTFLSGVFPGRTGSVRRDFCFQALSHFLTTRAVPYMNGGIQEPFRH